jgi:hypothetical protein
MFPLEYEFRILQVLEAHGIPVPHVYGLCPEPRAIVMAQAPGRPDLSTAASEDERCSVLDHYAEILAAIHGIDPAEFEAVGMKRPAAQAAIAHHLFEEFVTMYRAGKRRPEPMLEYFVSWVHRNAPTNRDRVSFVCGDPGQFLFEEGRVTAMLDFELAFLGEPIHDLAGLPLRDLAEPLGDMGRVVRRYGQLTGEKIEERVFDFHLIQWAVCTPLSMADNVSQPLPLGALVQYMEWFVHFARVPLELMARRAGIALPPLALPEFRPAKSSSMAEGLIGAIRAIPAADTYAVYQRDSAAQLATYLHRIAEMGPAFEQQDIADTEALLGKTFDGWQAADAALETFVQGAGAEQDPGLIVLFYRRMQRQAVLLEPLLGRPEAANSAKSFAMLMGRG